MRFYGSKNLFTWLSFTLLSVLSLLGAPALPLASMAQAQEPQLGDSLILRQNSTLFSQPGFGFRNWEEGHRSGVPVDRLAWPQKGDRVEYLSQVRVGKGVGVRQEGTYYRVRYTGGNAPPEGIEGFLNANILQLSRTSHSSQDALHSEAPCSACHSGLLSQANRIQDVISKASDGSHPDFKDSIELTKYLRKYRGGCANAPFNAYLNEYRHYISAASESFGIPEVALTCLLFRESQFQANARSRTGAIGIAQFTTVGRSEVDKHLRQVDDLSTLGEQLKNREDFIADYRSKLSRGERPTDWERERYGNFVVERDHMRLGFMWQDYIDSVRGRIGANPPWSGPYPTRFTEQRARDPRLAIGAAALYFRRIADRYGRVIEEDDILQKGDTFDLMVISSGAYNWGWGDLERHLKRKQKQARFNGTYRDWMRDQKGNWAELAKGGRSETDRHMESVRRCMESGVDDPPMGTRHPCRD